MLSCQLSSQEISLVLSVDMHYVKACRQRGDGVCGGVVTFCGICKNAIYVRTKVILHHFYGLESFRECLLFIGQ